MGFFDRFKAKEEKNEPAKRLENVPDLLRPKICVGIINEGIISEIDKVDWSQFGSAYGNTVNTIPYYLKNIFCIDEGTALDAAHQLWCSICHQGVNMASAALPSYEILRIGLVELSDNLKVEILDIFTGFALCTSNEYVTSPNELWDWEKQVQQKLIRDRVVFELLTTSSNEEVSTCAKALCQYLDNQKT
jgi:hypothetical protein